jgi:hypothetical protein
VLNSMIPNAQLQLQAHPSIARVALLRNALVSCNASFGNNGAAARPGFGMIAFGLAARTPAGAGRGAALHSLSPT